MLICNYIIFGVYINFMSITNVWGIKKCWRQCDTIDKMLEEFRIKLMKRFIRLQKNKQEAQWATSLT